MRQDRGTLGKLGRLAQLKSDLEMRRFAAFRAHVEASRSRIAVMEERLQALYDNPEAFTVAQARLTNAMTVAQVGALDQEKASLTQILPRFEQARQAAIREFGRAEVIRQIGRNQQQEERLEESRRS